MKRHLESWKINKKGILSLNFKFEAKTISQNESEQNKIGKMSKKKIITQAWNFFCHWSDLRNCIFY